MDSTWTAMIVFYCLLFSVALLLFTCLCILCKRKKRKTQDVNRILAAAATGTTVTGSRLYVPGRDRSDSTACCASADLESRNGSSGGLREVSVAPQNIVVGQINVVFESDRVGLPPDYEEALKSKYAKVYHIYPTLDRGRSSLASTASTSASTSAYQEETSTEIRSISGESPPPPYDVAVRHIDAAGHFS